MCRDGIGTERNKKMEVHHWDEAAIGGNSKARCNLAVHEGNNGRTERAMKHFIIAANLGCTRSIENLRMGYANGMIRKEEFAVALRANQTAIDAAKSPQREAAEAFRPTMVSQITMVLSIHAAPLT